DNLAPPTYRLLPLPGDDVQAVGYGSGFTQPRTYQWNAAIEQGLSALGRLSVTYVGAAGRDLVRQEQLFPKNPDHDHSLNAFVIRAAGWSDYRSLQVQHTRPLSAGLQSTLSYTWASSRDTGSSGVVTTSGLGFSNPQLDLGPSDFDVRHSLAGALTYL